MAKKRLKKQKKANIFYRIFRSRIFPLLYYFFSRLPIDKKKILFLSDSRKEMGGNFQFVYDELKARQENFKYWIFLKEETSAKKSYLELIRLAYETATARVIFLDDFYPIIYTVNIRKGAELVQLWHAVGAFKTFGYSRTDKPGGPSLNSRNHRNYTKAIVSSANIASHYAEGFGISKDKVIPTGIPRTDIFFDKVYASKIKEEIYRDYPIVKDKKVVLFSPTFRGRGQQSAYYDFDKIDFQSLNVAIGEEYIILFKFHPFVKEKVVIPEKYKEKFYDFSFYQDINKLLFVTDVLVTDYSSVCFEASLLNIPMLFYAYDLDSYIADRDFYYDYTNFIPGSLVKTANELSNHIKNRDYAQYRLENFIDYFFDHLDGHSSKRVVDEIVYKY